MTMNVGWQELYQAALLELRPEELRRRIDEAEKAIQQRIVELSRDDSSSEDERRAMDDALRGAARAREHRVQTPVFNKSERGPK